jgi:flagellum-specific ATP synthase
LRSLIAAVERIEPLSVSGRVAAVNGLLIEARGGMSHLPIGARAEIERRGATPLPAEVVGFRDTRALLMPFGPVEGVAPGAEIRIQPDGGLVRPTKAWLGRIVDAAFACATQLFGLRFERRDELPVYHPDVVA